MNSRMIMRNHFLSLTCLVITYGRLIESGFVGVTSSDCGKTKQCIQSPSTCTGANCDYFLSWKPVNASNQEYLEVELSGKVRQNTGYIAIGWSENNLMGNDGVISCIASASGTITIKPSYNVGHSTSPFVTAAAGFLMTGGITTSSGDNLLGGSFQAASTVVACRFRRLLMPTTEVNKLKDLSRPKKYYVLVSRGTLTTPTGLTMHFGGGNKVSGQSYEVGKAEFSSGAGTSKYPMAKAHACLMLIAWMFCINVGIVMARFFKPMWADKKLGGEKVWFQVHRTLQLLGVLLTVVAFIIIFVASRGYSQLTSLPGSAHPIIGIVVTFLALLNPTIALCRPHPDTPKRPIFNWVHFFIGTLAQILAVTNMFIGVKLNKTGSEFVALPEPFWIIVGFVIFIVVLEVAFSIDFYCLNKSPEGGANNMEMNKTDPQIQGNYETSINDGNVSPSSPPPPKSSACRSWLLALYVLGVGGCTVALVVLIILY